MRVREEIAMYRGGFLLVPLSFDQFTTDLPRICTPAQLIPQICPYVVRLPLHEDYS